jgi:hypothetical protein
MFCFDYFLIWLQIVINMKKFVSMPLPMAVLLSFHPYGRKSPYRSSKI